MNRAREFAVFTALALLVHVSLWAGGARTGSDSAGSGGQAAVSLMAATGDVVGLVDAWTRPVDALQELEAVPAASNPDQPDISLPSPPRIPLTEADSFQSNTVIVLPRVPEALPQIDTGSI